RLRYRGPTDVIPQRLIACQRIIAVAIRYRQVAVVLAHRVQIKPKPQRPGPPRRAVVCVAVNIDRLKTTGGHQRRLESGSRQESGDRAMRVEQGYGMTDNRRQISRVVSQYGDDEVRKPSTCEIIRRRRIA